MEGERYNHLSPAVNHFDEGWFMVFRVLSMSLILAGVALIGVAGYGYFTQPPPGPALVVHQTDIELSNLRAGADTEFTVPVQNNSKRPIKIVGLAWC